MLSAMSFARLPVIKKGNSFVDRKLKFFKSTISDQKLKLVINESNLPWFFFFFFSYTFRSESRPGTPQCLLSGDTSQSAGKNAFQIQSGALFSEKLCDGLNPRRDIPQRLPQVMTHIIIIMGYKGFVHFKNKCWNFNFYIYYGCT